MRIHRREDGILEITYANGDRSYGRGIRFLLRTFPRRVARLKWRVVMGRRA